MAKKYFDEKFYSKSNYVGSYHYQCIDVDPLTLDQFDRSVEQVKKIIDKPIFKTAKKIIGCGCGDSNLVAFSLKETFDHYLPDVEYIGVQAIELSRHYDYEEDETNTIGLFISVSGSVYRTREAMKQCQNHGITCIGMTDNPKSATATDCDIFYYTNSPKGDNHPGLRSIYANMISSVILAAAMAEVRTGKSCIPELREQIVKLHDEFFAEFSAIEDATFQAAAHCLVTEKKYFEFVGDGPMYWAGRIAHAKLAELSGDPCTSVDSENYNHVNKFIKPDCDVCDVVYINTNNSNVDRIVDTVNNMVSAGRYVLLICDKAPSEIGVEGEVAYCHMPWPEKEWDFLACVYGFMPGSIFAGYRHMTIGEPMFRGASNPAAFIPAYFADMEIVDISSEK